MDISKRQIAKIQIERAIDCFLEYHDDVSAITLAGAAEELLGNIVKKNGGLNALAYVFEVGNIEYSKFQDFRDEANRIRNELKHARDTADLNEEISVGIDDCAQILYRALLMYATATGEASGKMKDCWAFLRRNHDRIF